MLGRRNGQVNYCGWRHNPCGDGAENLSGLLFRDKESFLAHSDRGPRWAATCASTMMVSSVEKS